MGRPIEFRSPGLLPGHITAANMRTEHFSRDRLMMRNLKEMGLVEEFGDGIDRMALPGAVPLEARPPAAAGTSPVAVQAQAASAQPGRFSDVPEDAYFSEPVTALAALGVLRARSAIRGSARQSRLIATRWRCGRSGSWLSTIDPAASADARHACGVRTDGTIAFWGNNQCRRADAPQAASQP